MSNGGLVIMPAAWTAAEVSHLAFRVLAVVCIHARLADGEEAACLRKMADIAAAAGVDERSVRRALEELRDAGLVEVRRRFRDGRQTTNAVVPVWPLPDLPAGRTQPPARADTGSRGEEGAGVRPILGVSTQDDSPAAAARARTPEKVAGLTIPAEFDLSDLGLPADGEAALRGLLRGCPQPAALLSEIRMVAKGERGLRPTPAQLAVAVTDLAIAGPPFLGKRFRAFVRGAMEEATAPTTAGRRVASSGPTDAEMAAYYAERERILGRAG